MGQHTKMIEHLPFETSQVIGSRARIGIVVLATDYTIEHEMRALINLPGVDIYHARIPIRQIFHQIACGQWNRLSLRRLN